jgi:hypothetical protein
VDKITIELEFPENGQMNGEGHSGHLATTKVSERRENLLVKKWLGTK